MNNLSYKIKKRLKFDFKTSNNMITNQDSLCKNQCSFYKKTQNFKTLHKIQFCKSANQNFINLVKNLKF